MKNLKSILSITCVFVLLLLNACVEDRPVTESTSQKIDVIFDTDANNEIDDQHALAYLLFSGDYFNVEGVTVNATSSLGGFNVPSTIEEHYDEARRVMQLCGEFYGKIPLFAGARGSFEEIRDDLSDDQFDGYEAVNFIIEEAMKEREDKLVLLPVGKLTNIALALQKEPAIASRVRVVWLGSNYPETGEHNKVWDPESMNFILDIEADEWVERPSNDRELVLWEWFDIYGIMNDFFQTMENPVLVDV